MKSSKSYTVLAAIVVALALLAGAIAVPILCRPFYYAHIGPLRLVERTGLTEEEIKTAFDEMMDYCVGGEEFSTGALKWSESGKSHFTDVRFLFQMDLNVLACSLGLLMALAILSRSPRRRLRAEPVLGHGPAFWAGTGLGAVFLLTAILAAMDFDRAFAAFHALFFPGKDNWLFDPNLDQIINILPQAFFRNCAILILVILMAGCAALIAFDFRWKNGSKKIRSKLQKF